jgi:hypothetical protein
MDRLSRRSFINASAGVATGAVIAGTPAALVLDGPSAKEPAPRVVTPSSPPPSEPVMAYVRDAARGEVTILSGVTETTYHDPALVKRLLAAIPGGGEVDVLAP